MASWLVPIGTFFFRHRNWAFPVLVIVFFGISIPPSTVFGSEALEQVKDGMAIILAGSGLALRALVIGRDHVRRAGEGKTVHASRLYTGGMFSLCRNPLYTGNILIFAGIFLMHGNPWTVVLGLGSYLFVYRAIVAAEEDYLGRTFGAEYDRYRVAVPRWLPNLLRVKAVMADRPFDARRVLLVEYPNIGITAIALAAAELYEELEEPFDDASPYTLGAIGVVVSAALIWVGVVRIIKKRRIVTAT